MEIGNAYIPMDWRHVFASNRSLAETQTGATLFADISGFTPLTEAFALELGPKRGGEELTIHLNRVYDGLIGVLHRYGGSVVSFSGDAITCWLNEDLDGRRAVRCALEMQSIMLTLKDIVTPAGRPIELGLKVAVAIGEVKRFIVGLPEYTLMDAMAGKTVEQMASGENVAERGDVVVDQVTFAALEPYLEVETWRQEKKSGGDFAIVRGLSLDVEETAWETLEDSKFTQEMINHWLLPEVGTRITSGMGEFLTELRPATALFMRFTGIDYDNDPEAPLKLNTFVQLVQRIMMRLDGSLLQLTIGDKGSYMYAAFGAPVAHEDDTERAALAALAIQKEASPLDYIDPIQIGISYGRMRTGAYGAIQRRTYGVLGDHVNLSARLMSKASGGQIYVSENAYRSIQSLFTWEPLPPMKVKGKSYSVNVSRLVQRVERKTFKLHEPGYKFPMVGRQAELEAIEEKIDSVLLGKGQIVGITADAGMGKSRLTNEVIRSAMVKGLDAFAGECQSFGTNISYLVWHGLWQSILNLGEALSIEEQIKQVESQLELLGSDVQSRVPILGPLLNLPIPDNDFTASLDAKRKKGALEGLVVDILRSEAKKRPLILVLEDCHWLDDLSKDLIAEVGQSIGNLPVLLLLVYRPPDKQRLQMPKVDDIPYFSEISLNQFSKAEAETLIRLKISDFFGDAVLPDRFLKAVIDKAAGNPFYLDEIINFINDRGVDPSDTDALLALDLPGSIYSLVLSRIDALSESQKIAIRVASVIGRLFPAAVVWGIYPANEVTVMIRHDLEYLSNVELTPLETDEPELTYIFKHIVTQEVAYESLPYKTRAKLHGQVGSYFEFKYPERVEQNLDLLAFHYAASDNLPKKQEYLLRAGNAAKLSYANVAAIDYYTSVHPLLSGEEQIQMQLDLGEVYQVVGDLENAENWFQQTIRDADAGQISLLQSKGRVAMGELRRRQGRYPEAATLYLEAQAKSKLNNDQPGVAKSLICLGTLNAQQGEFDKALGFYNQSLSINRALNDAESLSNIYNNMAIVAEYQGDLAQSHEYHKQALEARRETNNKLLIATSLNNLGHITLSLGDHEVARGHLEEAIALQRAIGDKWFIANTLNNLGNSLRELREYGDAAEQYGESIKLFFDLGDKWSLAFLFEDIGMLVAQRDVSPIAYTLVGFAGKLRTEIESPLPDVLKGKLQEKLSPVRAEIGAQADVLLEEAQSIELKEAVTIALNGLKR